MSWKIEWKEKQHRLYSGYCISAREHSCEPLPYHQWQETGCPKYYNQVIMDVQNKHNEKYNLNNN